VALNLVLAGAAGFLLVLIHPPFGMWFLAPVAVTPLVWMAAREASAARRLLLGEASGMIAWFGLCVWIQFVLETHGGMGKWGGWGSFFLFCFLKAVHTAVFVCLAGWLMRGRWAALTAPALWAGLERTHGEFGFAWLTLGNAGIDMGVPMRLAPVTGVYGISFLFALMGTVVALGLMGRPRREMAPILLAPLLLLLPELPAPERGRESVVAVQPDFDEDRYYREDEMAAHKNELALLTLSEAMKADGPKPVLLVWPEVPAPLYYYNDEAFRREAANLTRLTGAAFLFGTVTNAPDGNLLNSAMLVGPQGNPASRYDKIYLVPFGEFVPPVFSFVNRITKEAGDFAPGRHIIVSGLAGRRFGSFICYESAFPELVRRFPNAGAEMLVNLTNDSYFGRTQARQQHLMLARMRAAENRRWLLRATNNGVTAAIDPAGRVVERFPEYRRTAGRLRFNWIGEKTLYTRYGDWFAWTCLAAGLAAAALSYARRHVA
jgi:apolipoprotein N-acyltransferase